MAGRQGIFHGEARAKLLRGVDIVAAAVMATLGPSGRTGARWCVTARSARLRS